MPTKIEISHKTIIFTVFFLLFLWIVFQVKDILFLLFVAFIIMSAIKPWVDNLENRRVPRFVSAFTIYFVFIAIIAFVISSIVPPLVTETIHLSDNLPGYISTYVPFAQIDRQALTQQITPLGQNLLKVTFGLFSNIIGILTIFVISFYLILERGNLDTQLKSFMGGEGAEKFLGVIKKIEERLGSWVRGQVTLGIVIGVATFIGLSLLGLPYVLPLSIIAGLLEIVPTIGPIISAVPAILVALTISPLFALATAALYFIIQQAENNLIVPFVMRRAVGLPPLVTLLSILAGAQLAGIGGAILAIPIVVTIETVISEYMKLRMGSPPTVHQKIS